MMSSFSSSIRFFLCFKTPFFDDEHEDDDEYENNLQSSAFIGGNYHRAKTNLCNVKADYQTPLTKAIRRTESQGLRYIRGFSNPGMLSRFSTVFKIHVAIDTSMR